MPKTATTQKKSGGKILLGLALVGGIVGIVYAVTRPKKKEEVVPQVSFVMKLYQAGVELSDTVAAGIETQAVVTATNASTYAGTPVPVDLEILFSPSWDTTPITVASQMVTVPANGSLDVTFLFTFPIESDGLSGHLVCQAVNALGTIVAEITLDVAIAIPLELINYDVTLTW